MSAQSHPSPPADPPADADPLVHSGAAAEGQATAPSLVPGGRQLLPSYHLRPSYGWLNDPNGMTYHDGRWHVFFQHNSAAPVHASIEWGHASSQDLITWREHPIAFSPTASGPDSFGCWSGVFFPGLDRPAVAYSGVTDESHQSSTVLRWGTPDLQSWSEPVVVAHTPTDAGVKVMRDPFLFTWRGQRWALHGAGLDSGEPAVLIYNADDPLAWSYAGLFDVGDHPDEVHEHHADIWECPQLLVGSGDDPDAALLILSLLYEGLLTGVIAVVGRLTDHDGAPRFVAQQVHRLDLGNAYYAPQLALDPSGADALIIGWVRQESLSAPTDQVAGCMSLPRRISLHGTQIRYLPDPALAGLEIGAEDHLPAGPVPEHCRITAGGHAVELHGALAGQDYGVTVPAGALAWIDAGVIEVYPPEGPPSTIRVDPGTLVAPATPEATIAEVLTIAMH